MTTTKGARTRRRVVELAAPVFNQKGYWGTSLSDVMAATGLEKGGIYNHFSGKEELAVAAFDHNVGILREHLRSALAPHRHAVDRLLAVIGEYVRFAEDPPIPGGCPLLNTAVDADDSQPVLRERVRAALHELLEGTVARIARRGVERGELAAGTDPAQLAAVIVAALEGALMLNQLYGDPAYVRRVADHLADHVRSLTGAIPPPGAAGEPAAGAGAPR